MMSEEEKAHGTISNKVYISFAKEGVGSHLITIAFVALVFAVEVSVTVSNSRICLCQ